MEAECMYKNISDALKNISMLAQLGLSLITPLLVCLGICWYLDAKLGIGSWVYILGFFFGLGGSFTFAWKVYLMVMKGEDKKKNEKKNKVYFNRHL